jgi:hypothetical protein
MKKMLVFDVEWQETEKALTAGELINILKNYDEDTPVAATWEGVHSPLLLENLSVHDAREEYL